MSSTKAPPGHFTLLYFASAVSFTKKDSEHLPAPLPYDRLFDELEQRYPGLKERVLRSCAVTVNLEYVDVDPEQQEADGDAVGDGQVRDRSAQRSEPARCINEGDEVAIIPPVSSG